jgi:hypothetical protein
MASCENHQQWEGLVQHWLPRRGMTPDGTRWQWEAGEAVALMYGTTVSEQHCMVHTFCREGKGHATCDLRTPLIEHPRWCIMLNMNV